MGPLGGKEFECIGGFTPSKERALAIPNRPLGENLDRAVEPDRETGVEQPCAGHLVGEGAAAGGDDLRTPVEKAPDGLALDVAETCLAHFVEDPGDAHPRRSLHLLVRIGERQTEAPCEQAPDRRLAGTHQTDKGDRSVNLISPGGHEAGAIQIALCWGKRPAMPRPRYDFGPQRRRRSPLPTILILLLVLIVGLLVYASTVDTEVPVGPIEQDVTNEVLAQ